MVKMIQVDSSNIESIGYDPVEKELFVKFKDDGSRVYKYMGVPRMVWQRMLRYESKGTFVKQILIPYFDVEQTAEKDVVGITL